MIEFIGGIQEEHIERLLCLVNQNYMDEAIKEVSEIADELGNYLSYILIETMEDSLK